MISGVTMEIGGSSETFRMSNRAMRSIEAETGQGIIEVMQGMDNGFRVGILTVILAKSANDGKGRDLEWADDAIDEIGFEAAGKLIGDIAEAAFPEAKKGAPAKNQKRAARSK